MNTLRSKIIRLAYDKPELRSQLLPLLKTAGSPRTARRDLGTVQVGKTPLRHHVESYTPVYGFPKDQLRKFRRLLEKEMETLGTIYEHVNFDEMKVIKDHGDTVDLKVEWYTFGEDLNAVGDGEYGVKSVLKQMGFNIEKVR